jgi:lipoprotein-releasing system ATP-binding protein
MDDPRASRLVDLRDVHKSYGTAVVTEVLHGIDFVMERGEFTALMGPSGSGKSTLLNLLGLLDRPTVGSIALDGREVGALSDAERTTIRGSMLGFVFQFHHLLPEFTALENVTMPLLATRGRADAAMRERGRELLQAIGLDHRMSYRATDLSGGEQQRVAIARALAMNPPLVLADEPTGNLDTETGDQVFELLRQFNRKQKTAFLIVTHDAGIAGRCDRVIEMRDGRLVRDSQG